MKKVLVICLVVVMLVCVSNVSAAYIGSLSTSDGGLTGTGVWVQGNGSILSWEITPQVGFWHYKYELIVPSKDISHLIVEVSENFELKDAFNKTGNFGCTEIGDYSESDGNPGMPGGVHGLKFDETIGTDLVLEFDSARMPVWGDVYSKDGKSGDIFNALWNSGFTAVDPDISAHNGSESFHALVPDTIPEPATIAILGIGSLLLIRKK